jgi:hypothetical protein
VERGRKAARRIKMKVSIGEALVVIALFIVLAFGLDGCQPGLERAQKFIHGDCVCECPPCPDQTEKEE